MGSFTAKLHFLGQSTANESMDFQDATAGLERIDLLLSWRMRKELVIRYNLFT
jgi:hypothetical protein